MTTYRMIARPKPSIITLDFGSYNEAIEFANKSALLRPSRPYRRPKDGKWLVSMVGSLTKAQYAKLPHWEKPFPDYDRWKGVEALYHLPVPVPEEFPKFTQRELEQMRMDAEGVDEDEEMLA